MTERERERKEKTQARDPKPKRAPNTPTTRPPLPPPMKCSRQGERERGRLSESAVSVLAINLSNNDGLAVVQAVSPTLLPISVR